MRILPLTPNQLDSLLDSCLSTQLPTYPHYITTKVQEIIVDTSIKSWWLLQTIFLKRILCSFRIIKIVSQLLVIWLQWPLTLKYMGNHKSGRIMVKGPNHQFSNIFWRYSSHKMFKLGMLHLSVVGIEQRSWFVDSTMLRNSKVECPECIPDARDASIMDFL